MSDLDVPNGGTDDEEMIFLDLVPIIAYGDDYGLMDATSVGSDCNRAHGHMFRICDSEIAGAYERGEAIRVYARVSDIPALTKDYTKEYGRG